MNLDYAERKYLSVSEVSTYTGLTVKEVHKRVKSGEITAVRAGSGQYRFELKNVSKLRKKCSKDRYKDKTTYEVVGDTTQTIVQSDARNMHHIENDSVHLAITSPPYFDAKMYSESQYDLGNIHNLDEWLQEIKQIWKQVYLKVQPGRKFFLNIMNLPIRHNKSFRTLNLVGKNVDICESVGFIFKRDIVWQKTNGVRAHFGTYPYPGGILINHMHEFILEFEKPAKPSVRKYAHVSTTQREQSKLNKEFWLSIKNSDVWLMKPERSGNGRNHAAPYPLELPSRLITAYSFVGETVLDPFLGSGTTLLAASILGRNGIGYEINQEFCIDSKNRLSAEL